MSKLEEYKKALKEITSEIKEYYIFIQDCYKVVNTLEDYKDELKRKVQELTPKVYINYPFIDTKFPNNIYCFIKQKNNLCVYSITHRTFWKEGLPYIHVERDKEGKCYITKEHFSKLVLNRQDSIIFFSEKQIPNV